MSNFYVQTPSGRNYTFDLDKPEVTIGRELKNDLILDDPRVSRYHAVALQSADGFSLRDLESGNAPFVNGQHTPANTAFKLANNDQIKLGSCLLTFQSTDPLQTKFSDTDSLREVIQKTPNDLLITKAFVGANTAQ